MVISELAANSVAYSGGPWLLAHVTEVSATHAAVLITEWRGPGTPAVMDTDADSESGRGLAIVRLLSCFFHIGEGDNARNILAVVPADPPISKAKRSRSRSGRRLARRTVTEEHDMNVPAPASATPIG
jgi:hypothetical protein